MTYIDPLTGILLRRATSPGAFSDASNVNFQFSQVIDLNSSWTSPASVLTSSNFASYGGTGTSADSLFFVAPLNLSGLKGFSTRNTFLDMRLNVSGKGTATAATDRTLSACLSIDHGQTCASATVDLPALPTGTAAIVSFPSSGYPSPVFAQWTAAGGTRSLHLTSKPEQDRSQSQAPRSRLFPGICFRTWLRVTSLLSLVRDVRTGTSAQLRR